MQLSFVADVTYNDKAKVTFTNIKTDMNDMLIVNQVRIPERFDKAFGGAGGNYNAEEFTRLLRRFDPTLKLMEEITPFSIRVKNRFDFRSSPVKLWVDGNDIYLFTGNNVFHLYKTKINKMLVCTKNYKQPDNSRSFACDPDLLEPAMRYLLTGYSKNAAKADKLNRDAVIEVAKDIIRFKPEKSVFQGKVIKEERKKKAFFNRPSLTRPSMSVAY